MTNALTFCTPNTECKKTNIVVRNPAEFVRLQAEVPSSCKAEFYQFVGVDTTEFFLDALYLSTIFVPDSVLDAVIEHVLGGDARLIADASRKLAEVGACDVKHGCDPIAYLHKLGLLTGAQIAGGVYLDRDGADLMVQESASLILTPTFDAGYGNGIAPFRLYRNRGLTVSLGTMDNVFNPAGSTRYEADVLRLLVNGIMCGETVTERELCELIG